MNVYGPRIARARKLAGLTQEDLADLLEVNVQTIKRHEQANGKEPRKVDRLAIAAVLGISMDYLDGLVADPLAATEDVARKLAEHDAQLRGIKATLAELGEDWLKRLELLESQRRDAQREAEGDSPEAPDGGGRP